MKPSRIDTSKLHTRDLTEGLRKLRALASLEHPDPERVGAVRYQLTKKVSSLLEKIHDTCNALLGRGDDEHQDPSARQPAPPRPSPYSWGTDEWDTQRKTIPWSPKNMEELQTLLATKTPIGIAPLSFDQEVLESAMKIQQKASLDTRGSIAVLCALIEARRDSRKVTAETLAEQLSYNIGSVSGALRRLRDTGLKAVTDALTACRD